MDQSEAASWRINIGPICHTGCGCACRPDVPIAIQMAPADTANADRSITKSRHIKDHRDSPSAGGKIQDLTRNGSPNQVPFKKFLICCATGRPPAYSARSRTFCNLSSMGAGRDESRFISTSFPLSIQGLDFPEYPPFSIHHVAAIATLISRVPNTLAPRAGSVQGDLWRRSSTNAPQRAGAPQRKAG